MNTTQTNLSDRFILPDSALRPLFVTLFLSGMLGVVTYALSLPYLLANLPPELTDGQAPPPMAILIIATTVQTGAILALAVWGGLTLSQQLKVNPAPILTGALKENVAQRLIFGLTSGFIAGLLMLVVYRLLFLPVTGVPMNIIAGLPPGLALSNAFLYGGITEELLFRLGLMTLFLWLAGKVWGDVAGRPTPPAFWGVNGIITILFGLGHLPGAALLVTITPLVILQALVLNSVALLFGWLYWRRGIETAIAAHIAVHLGYTTIGLMFGL